MAMAQYAAAIGGVHLDRFRDAGKAKCRTGKKIPDYGLKVAVGQAAARHKWGEPPRKPRGGIVKPCMF
jgi:hypothetical protein